MALYKCALQKRFDDDGNPLCTYESNRPWKGRCSQCHRLSGWVKVGADAKPTKVHLTLSGDDAALAPEKPRISMGIPEFDRVLGGGLTVGSKVIMSGPPGTGKTTIALQAAKHVADKGKRVVFASGEQTYDAIISTARRIGVIDDSKRITVLPKEGNVEIILAEASKIKPAMVVIDSLQKAYMETVGGVPGSSSQCAEIARTVIAWCNETDIAVFIISQVNKDGEAAGPLAVQHDFDTLIEFDPRPELDSNGEIKPRTKDYVRMMSGKNRYGERGLFEMFNMTAEGLVPLGSNLLRFSSR